GADAELDVVGDDGAKELAAGFFLAAAEGNEHGGAGVFEVAGGGTSAQVGPFADDGVADEAVMLFVGVAQENGSGDFTADSATGAEGAFLADVVEVADDAVGADGDGAGDDSVGADFGVVLDDDGTVLCV